MKRENFYTLVIIVLLLLNIGTLAFLWQSRGERHLPPPPPDSPDNIIIHELKLDDEQQQQFLKFKHMHRRSTDSVQRHIKDAQRSLFALVKQDQMDTVARDSLLNVIEQNEAAKHLITIQHFHDIRSILSPEQKELFNDLVEDIGGRITGPGRRGQGPPPPPRR
ncbi:MAG: periplasmic heavy metal sensor [Chitinophagaceae bacterium]|nr:periplasmic heavy metal sensor [Chitinophagaceae bacterium]MCB9045945.1 periplasmic heavy metal sensor [Chitinophagales bacterium]